MRLVLWKLSTSTSYDFIIWLPSQFDLLPMIFWDSSTLYYSNSLLFKTWEYKLSSSSMKNIAKDFFPNMCGIIVGLILIFFLFFLKTNKIWTNEIYTYSLRMVFFSENDFFGSITFQLTPRTPPSSLNKSWEPASTTLTLKSF